MVGDLEPKVTFLLSSPRQRIVWGSRIYLSLVRVGPSLTQWACSPAKVAIDVNACNQLFTAGLDQGLVLSMETKISLFEPTSLLCSNDIEASARNCARNCTLNLRRAFSSPFLFQSFFSPDNGLHELSFPRRSATLMYIMLSRFFRTHY